MAVMQVYHPSDPQEGNTLKINEQGSMIIQFNRSEFRSIEHHLLKVFRRIGYLSASFLIQPSEPGLSNHYAGPLPMRANPQRPYETDRNGLLFGKRHVYIGDSASFPRLPAKNLTFTIMANAMRIARTYQNRIRVKNMKVFITGIHGFIAGHLSIFLRDQGYQVCGSTSRRSEPPDRQSTPEKIYYHKLGEGFEGSMFAGMDVVIHCAHDFQKGALRRNIEGTLALAEAAKHQQVSKQIFVSSLSARPDAQTEYGKTKYAIEQVFQKKRRHHHPAGDRFGLRRYFWRNGRYDEEVPCCSPAGWRQVTDVYYRY